MTPQANVWVGRERGQGREMCLEHLLCAKPSARCWRRRKRHIVGSCPEGAYTLAHGSQVHCQVWLDQSLPQEVTSISTGSGISLVRQLTGELYLLSQQSQELYFCLRRSANLFFYYRVCRDQFRGLILCIFHFGLSVKDIFSFSAITG